MQCVSSHSSEATLRAVNQQEGMDSVLYRSSQTSITFPSNNKELYVSFQIQMPADIFYKWKQFLNEIQKEIFKFSLLWNKIQRNIWKLLPFSISFPR